MPLIALRQAVARHPERQLASPTDFTLFPGEQVAVVGRNGSGKTLFTNLLSGQLPLRSGTLHYCFTSECPESAYGNIVHLTFEDVLGTVEKPYYFQQRFNAQDREESPRLRTVLLRALESGGEGLTSDEARCAVARFAERGLDEAKAIEHLLADNTSLLDTFDLRPLLDKRIVELSSGEMRRYQLAKSLLRHPRLLIVDSPFIGLDTEMRRQLDTFFQRLVAEGEVQLLMVLSDGSTIPDYLTHVVEVAQRKVGPKLPRAEWQEIQEERARRSTPTAALPPALTSAIVQLPPGARPNLSTPQGGGAATTAPDEVVAVQGLSLRLEGGRTLYGGLDWTVRQGESWALQGRNGSGKSTLLSLLCADHPAAYACHIRLFGRRRGTGESIWEVKQHIGFVSPELHRAYRRNCPALDIVASGLHDSVGLYRRPRPEQHAVCRFWMEVMGIENLSERPFLSLSSGEQRLVLLARAFVKNPALLILDEPFHGLDPETRRRVQEVIAVFCHRPDKTLILVSHYAEHLPHFIDHRLQL